MERKTRSLTVDEVKAVERERQSTALTLLVGGVVEGFVPKTEVRRWTLLAILVRQWFSAPKWRGSQNNVQPLVSPWSWDYTLLLLQTQDQNGDALVTLPDEALSIYIEAAGVAPYQHTSPVPMLNSHYGWLIKMEIITLRELTGNGVLENERLWIEGK